jgi:hypothetical protein
VKTTGLLTGDAPTIEPMSARTTRLACQCGSTAEVCWSELGYRTADNVRIDRVCGPVIVRRHKRRGPWEGDDSTADILCQRCGSLLHEGEKLKAAG